LLLRADGAVAAHEVLGLPQAGVLQRFIAGRHEDQTRDVRFRGGDARGYHPAQAVAQDVDALRVDGRVGSQQPHRGHCVVHNLLLHREAPVGRELLGVDHRPLVVAKHRDPGARKPLGQVQEGLVRPDTLMAVVGAGAVHQHDCGEGAVGRGDGQLARKRIPAATHDHPVGGEVDWFDIVRRAVLPGRLEPQTTHLPRRVEVQLRQEHGLLKPALQHHNLNALVFLRVGLVNVLERAGLVDQRLPDRAQYPDRESLHHLRVEAGDDILELPVGHHLDEVPGGLDGLRLHRLLRLLSPAGRAQDDTHADCAEK